MYRFLVILFMSPILVFSQMSGRYISFDLFIDQVVIGVHPDATIDQDPNLDRHYSQFWSKSYSSYHGSYDGYQSPQYESKLSINYLPDPCINLDTKEYIYGVYGKKTQCLVCWGYDDIVYPKFWKFNLDGIDAYYRSGPGDDWIYLNPLIDTLTSNPEYFGNVYDPGSTDYDGYVMCFQIKFKIPSGKEGVRDPINVISLREGWKFTAHEDNYMVDIYDMAGQIVYSGSFEGNEYMAYSGDLGPGWYIYTLNSRSGSWSGKVWKF